MTVTTICGTDLHIWKGDVPAVRKGRTLGHEGVGVIEAVGTLEAFDTCQAIIAPGGHIANIGVHGKSVNLLLEKLWNKNITLTTTWVDTFSISTFRVPSFKCIGHLEKEVSS